jgi:hypothetical protein
LDDFVLWFAEVGGGNFQEPKILQLSFYYWLEQFLDDPCQFIQNAKLKASHREKDNDVVSDFFHKASRSFIETFIQCNPFCQKSAKRGKHSKDNRERRIQPVLYPRQDEFAHDDIIHDIVSLFSCNECCWLHSKLVKRDFKDFMVDNIALQAQRTKAVGAGKKGRSGVTTNSIYNNIVLGVSSETELTILSNIKQKNKKTCGDIIRMLASHKDIESITNIQGGVLMAYLFDTEKEPRVPHLINFLHSVHNGAEEIQSLDKKLLELNKYIALGGTLCNLEQGAGKPCFLQEKGQINLLQQRDDTGLTERGHDLGNQFFHGDAPWDVGIQKGLAILALMDDTKPTLFAHHRNQRPFNTYQGLIECLSHQVSFIKDNETNYFDGFGSLVDQYKGEELKSTNERLAAHNSIIQMPHFLRTQLPFVFREMRELSERERKRMQEGQLMNKGDVLYMSGEQLHAGPRDPSKMKLFCQLDIEGAKEILHDDDTQFDLTTYYMQMMALTWKKWDSKEQRETLLKFYGVLDAILSCTKFNYNSRFEHLYPNWTTVIFSWKKHHLEKNLKIKIKDIDKDTFNETNMFVNPKLPSDTRDLFVQLQQEEDEVGNEGAPTHELTDECKYHIDCFISYIRNKKIVEMNDLFASKTTPIVCLDLTKTKRDNNEEEALHDIDDENFTLTSLSPLAGNDHYGFPDMSGEGES